MAYTITVGMDYGQIASKLRAGGQISIQPGTYQLNSNSHAYVQVPSNTVIEGNGAIFECWSGVNSVTGDWRKNQDSQWVMFQLYGSGIKVNNLTVKGRIGFYLHGDNHHLTRVIVNQHSNHSGAVYEHLNGPYAGFWIDGRSSNIRYDYCEAWYTNHHGFGVFISKYHYSQNCPGSPSDASTINTQYNYCKAMYCGSRWENQGDNPWGWGFDMGESQVGPHTFVATGCVAYDCLQGGFYAGEGAYSGRCQVCRGTFNNCHAERGGMRILEAWRTGQPIIRDSYKAYYMPVDFYGHGFRLTDCSTLNNCTTKNCAHCGVIQVGSGITVNGHSDDGSSIGIYIIGNSPSINNYTSINSKVFAFAAWGSSTKLTNMKVIDFKGNIPILVNAPPGSAVRKLTDFQYWYKNDDAMKATDGQSAVSSLSGFRSVGNTSSINAQVKVNQSDYNSKDKCVGGHRHSGTGSSSVSVSMFTPVPMDYPKMPDVGQLPTVPCNSIDCTKKVRRVCDQAGNITEQPILETDPDYIAQCTGSGNPGGCTGTEVRCIDGREMQCKNGVFVATGKTCEGSALSAFPAGSTYLLNKTNTTKVYARDFAIGGKGNAFFDSSSGNSGSSTYRSDAGDVDLVDWGTRISEPDDNKVVVAYTEPGDWLKYVFKVDDNGTYTVNVRASNGTSSTAKLTISVDGDARSTIDIPPTGGYEIFQTFTTDVVFPYVGNNEVMKVEFDGDINLFWFQAVYKSANGGKVRFGGEIQAVISQAPYTTIVVRNEYGYSVEIQADWYDYGGEGKAYHNVPTSRNDTYHRSLDAIELSDDGSIATSDGEWVEYTVNISANDNYYFEVNVKDVKAAASIKIEKGAVVLATINLPVCDDSKWVAVPATVPATLLTEYGAILKVSFTGDFLFKSFVIKSSATVENKVFATPYRDIEISTAHIAPVVIEAYEFDLGGPGVSYMDNTNERFIQKPVRDSDVDVVVIGKAGQVFINNTMKGEWVQYTFKNSIEADYKDYILTFNCSSTNSMPKINFVLINEKYDKTYNERNEFSNKYVLTPPRVPKFTNVQNVSIPVRIYKGRNTLRVYFDDDITMGQIKITAY